MILNMKEISDLKRAENIENKSGLVIGGFQELFQKTKDLYSNTTITETNIGNLIINNHFDKVNGISLSNWGQLQLANKLELPQTYIEKLKENEMYQLLFANILNWQKHHSNKKILLRKTENEFVGVLSNRFGFVEDYQVLQYIQDLINKNFTLKQYYISAEYMSLRIVSNKKINVNGEELYLGLQIQNSNVGKASFKINLFLFRSICSNGLIFGKKDLTNVNYRHIGDIAEAVHEAIYYAVSSFENYQYEVETMINTAIRIKVENRESLLEKLRGINKTEIDGIVEISKHYDDTLWGLVNAITHYSQTKNIHRREELEKTAADLLSA